jgi:hypothetical protein
VRRDALLLVLGGVDGCRHATRRLRRRGGGVPSRGAAQGSEAVGAALCDGFASLSSKHGSVWRWAAEAVVLCIQVDSRAALALAWTDDPSFLLIEVAAWLQKGSRGLLEQLWPTLVAASADGKVVEAVKCGRKKGSGAQQRKVLH